MIYFLSITLRLNLDRRKLTQCPILEGEEQLRLLNYQVLHLDIVI